MEAPLIRKEALSIRREGMADPKGSKPSIGTASMGIHVKNAINVVMEYLSEEYQKKIERELESKMAEQRSRKLACF
jgi:hypothetical protein